jgi:prephenate dehydratase
MYGGSDPTRITAAERPRRASADPAGAGSPTGIDGSRAGPGTGSPSDGAARRPGPIAFAGEPGAFAEDALLAFFGDVERLALPSFRSVFAAVAEGRAAAGVLPIENLVNGTVRENYDLLLEHDLVIGGEVVVPVRLCLAALPGERLEGIERVYSHLQALGQAERFLRSRPWQLLTTYNTAGAGRLIVERGERGAAAVLSPRAAALFGLEVLVADVADVPDNRTRFLVVARPDEGAPPAWLAEEADRVARRRAPAAGERAPAAPRMRTTLVLAVENVPGALLRVLAVLAERQLNMSKLESRPSRERAWEYVFWVDLDGALRADEPEGAETLAALHRVTTMCRVLGVYPAGEA